MTGRRLRGRSDGTEPARHRPAPRGDVAARRARRCRPPLAATLAGIPIGLVVVAAVVAVLGAGVAAQDAQGESSPVEADEAVGTGRAVIGDGHVDVGPKFVDGEWTLLVRDDTVDPSVWRRLPDVVLQATDAAVLQVPDDPTFAFLGPAGAQVWVLPQVQQTGILWPGWNTQDPEVATTVDREVTWTLRGIEGPGDFVLFFNRDFGEPETVFDSRQPYPQELGVEANTHAHGNWAFTAPGVYLLDVEMSTATADGEDLSARGSLRIAVGDATNPDEAFAAGSDPDATNGEDSGSRQGSGAGGGSASGPGAGAASHTDGDGSSYLVAWLVAGAALLLVGAALVWARRRQAGGTSPVGRRSELTGSREAGSAEPPGSSGEQGRGHRGEPGESAAGTSPGSTSREDG